MDVDLTYLGRCIHASVNTPNEDSKQWESDLYHLGSVLRRQKGKIQITVSSSDSLDLRELARALNNTVSASLGSVEAFSIKRGLDSLEVAAAQGHRIPLR